MNLFCCHTLVIATMKMLADSLDITQRMSVVLVIAGVLSAQTISDIRALSIDLLTATTRLEIMNVGCWRV